MGIKGLTKFLADNAPKSIQYQTIGSLLGKKVAVDASMWIYQFLAAIREGSQWGNLTNSSGESTSHISGMLSRTTRLLEAGIKPVFVFDGTPPEMKKDELAKRDERREKALAELEKAQEMGDGELIKKQSIRTIHVTKKQIEDVKKLLNFLGMPYIDAPSEAEAQCAELCKDGLVYGVVTEDADSLTFGTPVQIKQLNFSESSSNKVNDKSPGKQKNGMQIIKLPLILSELDITMEQFIDLCILSGCDYCGTIRGIGTNTAYKLLKKHQNIEKILQNIDKTKNPVPENFEFSKVRDLFKKPIVTKRNELEELIKWSSPKYEELTDWLVKEQNFSEARVTSYCERIRKSRSKTSQTCLDGFFKSKSNERKMSHETPLSKLSQSEKPKEKTCTGVNSSLNRDTKKVKIEECRISSEWGVPISKSSNDKTEKGDFGGKSETHNETKEFQINKGKENKEHESSTVENTPLKTKSPELSNRPVKRKLNRLIDESNED
ncbi:Flap endonuclease 1 [Cryptosporidium ubiquitum]|uniref:Flap endonuclease 1 n=1 Tax=Cryptosporidium ubiquitum TaxID=857276 RepID=A0A1J4MIP3_9CRYT|nr:Flap endonuclease 1 [Cryptosporidium ubiquitum]OII74088.1 Flap endonuclease 1 [Cryptosporidium ubiquitum]